MLRRRCSRSPSILNPRRLASIFASINSFPPPRKPIDPAISFAVANGSDTIDTKNKKSNGHRPPPSHVRVFNPETKRAITLQLKSIKPFTPEFALLPRAYRLFVERRDLQEKLLARLDTVRQEDEELEEENPTVVPNEKVVKQYMRKFLRDRRRRTAEPLSEGERNQLLELARSSARKKESRQITASQGRKSQTLLSFEEQWRRRDAYGKNILKPMTSEFIARYNPKRDLKNPVKPRNVTIEQLLAAGTHIGHNKSACHPAMKPFITGLHGTTHIINLDYTIAHLRRACTIIREVAFRHGIILFIGTRKGHKPILVAANERMGSYLLDQKWIPGTITNAMNVLHKGVTKEEPTVFPKYSHHRRKKETAENTTVQVQEGERKMERRVWGPSVDKWVLSDDELGSPKNKRGQLWFGDETPCSSDTTRKQSTMAVTAHTSASTVSKYARKHGHIADWMAWNKFATIVQSVSDISAAIIDVPALQLPKSLTEWSLDSVSEATPDHTDNWYTRQLEEENAEIRRRHTIAYENGDRNAIEMHEMDKFLARKRYNGTVRGEYVIDRVKKHKEDGLQGLPNVITFRDGTTMVAKRRFTKEGKPLLQYSDGSYLHGKYVYDRHGQRFDALEEALVFSDGSQLRFHGKEQDRSLVIIIGEQMFDVTSTVIGSAQKREILEKAEELLHQSATRRSVSHTTESTDATIPSSDEHTTYESQDLQQTNASTPILRPRVATNTEEQLSNVFGSPMNTVDFTITKIEAAKVEETQDTYVAMQGSEMLELSDNVDAKNLDDFVGRSNTMDDNREDLTDVEKPEPEPPTPFDKSATQITTIRPDLIVFLNPRENYLGLREATNGQIPTIGIVDTDCDPRRVTYSIPGNDDSLRSVEYIIGVLSRAGEEGLIHRKRFSEQLYFLKERARRFLKESWEDYDAVAAPTKHRYGDEPFQPSRIVMEKYCKWYNVDEETSLDTIRKLIGHHVVMAQEELKRLNADTTGWAMQDFLDQVQTSTQFPSVPLGVLEEMAQVRMDKSRQAWAEAREKMSRRKIMV